MNGAMDNTHQSIYIISYEPIGTGIVVCSDTHRPTDMYVHMQIECIMFSASYIHIHAYI